MIIQQVSSDFASLKDVAAAVQSFAIALAALFGGLWALYTFKAKRDKDRAEAEILELQRKLQVQACIEPSMIITPVHSRQKTYLSIIVSLKNNGSRNIRLDFSKRTLAVAQLNFDGKSGLQISSLKYSPVINFSSILQDEIWELPYLISEAGNIENLPFWVCIENPGLYFVSFKAKLTGPEATTVPFSAGGETEHDFFAEIRQFINVEVGNDIAPKAPQKA